MLRLIRVKSSSIPQLIAPPFGLQKVFLYAIALFTLDLARDVLIRYFINNNVKIFTVNRVTQQPYFDLLFLLTLEPAK